MRKAKIVDTIGPSTEDYDNLLKLVEAGMDVARLNRSHGTPEDHLKVYNNVRKASEATGRNVAALVDLQGPKIRCGWFKKSADGEDKVQLQLGQEFVITTDDVEGDEHITSTTFKAASKKYEDAQMFRDWLLMSSAPQKVALEQNTGYMFLLSNGLNGNHIEQPEKLWLNTAYNTLVQQEILTNKWLQSARFAVK